MAEELDTITRHTFTKQKQPKAVSELSYHQPHQPPQQDFPLSYSKLIQSQGRGTACRRASLCTVEQVFYKQVIMEKHLCDMFHNFIDFKKAFDRVWHAGLWQVLLSFNTQEELVQAILALNKNSNSAVLLNSQLWEFFKTILGVHQGCTIEKTRLVQACGTP